MRGAENRAGHSSAKIPEHLRELRTAPSQLTGIDKGDR